MTALRSFFTAVPGGACPREGYFHAPVTEFLGVVAAPGGFAILTLCAEDARPASGLILPGGGVAAQAGLRWTFQVRQDGEAPPEPRRVRCGAAELGTFAPKFVGAAALGHGVIYVFVSAELPPGVEFVT